MSKGNNTIVDIDCFQLLRSIEEDLAIHEIERLLSVYHVCRMCRVGVVKVSHHYYC